MLQRVKQVWNTIPKWMRNRYFVAIAVFGSILVFLDRNNVFQLVKRKRALYQIEKQIERYNNELIFLREQDKAFTNDKEALEKFAREEYRMKKDDEDVFVILEKEE